MYLLADLWSSLGYYRNGLTWKAIRGREERRKEGNQKGGKEGGRDTKRNQDKKKYHLKPICELILNTL